MSFIFDQDRAHCSNHYHWSSGCPDCDRYLLYQEKYETKLEKLLISTHPLEIKPGDPGPKLQLIRQQATRKIFVFLQNASSDVVKAVNKRVKEFNKISDAEKRSALLAAAYMAIDWGDFIKEITLDLMEASKSGIMNGLEQLAVTRSTEEIDKEALDYSNIRTAEMVSKKWDKGKLVDNPGARYSIAETTNDDLHDIIENVLSNNLLSKIEEEIIESGIFGRKRAELIAKTEIAMAQSRGNLDTWKRSNLIKSVNIVVSPGHDVTDLCDEHIAKNPWSINEVPELPLHPNCSCSLEAVN